MTIYAPDVHTLGTRVTHGPKTTLNVNVTKPYVVGILYPSYFNSIMSVVFQWYTKNRIIFHDILYTIM